MRSKVMIRLIPLTVMAILCLSLAAQPARPQRGSEQQRAATATFLDRQRPETERLRAARLLGWPENKTFPLLLAVGADRAESDAIRFAALYHHHRFSREWLDTILKILDDPNDGGAELDAKLTEELNRRITFRLPPEVRQRILTIWRKLLKDPRDRVRLAAFRALAANHDAVAVNQLDESLRRGSGIPIPIPDAIELLDLNGPVNHITALRPFLSHRDPAVQGRAARALALDPESRPRIVELATSASTAEEVRLHALRGLAREDQGFAAYALPLLENVREDADVRFAAMKAFVGRMNYNSVPAREQIRFAEAVERFAKERNLPPKILRQTAETLVYLKQGFPEIQKHYEGR
ncbi:MAG TPA: hypothetical protein VEK57_02285 [Thermoanaerobaculia bacterium]|nr:hypothetical protein [Thermoanaerobaculia bacterium]